MKKYIQTFETFNFLNFTPLNESNDDVTDGLIEDEVWYIIMYFKATVGEPVTYGSILSFFYKTLKNQESFDLDVSKQKHKKILEAGIEKYGKYTDDISDINRFRHL